MNRVEELLAKLPEQYQDVTYQGKTCPGVKSSNDRWTLIQRYIPTGRILDIGSAQGYFTNKMSDNLANTVYSFEINPDSCEIQRLITEEKQNVQVINQRLSEDDVENLPKTLCFDSVDLTLALAVLHHFRDPERVLNAWSSYSRRIILEIPHPDEAKAKGQEAIKWIYNGMDLTQHYEMVRLLGFGQSHLGEFRRPIYLCEQSRVIR